MTAATLQSHHANLDLVGLEVFDLQSMSKQSKVDISHGPFLLERHQINCHGRGYQCPELGHSGILILRELEGRIAMPLERHLILLAERAEEAVDL